MTTLEMILIIYILLNWFLGIMVGVVPRRFIRTIYFILIIICPPLIIGFIVEGIIENHNKREKNERTKGARKWNGK